MSGSRVPRSPRDPEISAHGAARTVARLLRFRRRKSLSHEGAMAWKGAKAASSLLGCVDY